MTVIDKSGIKVLKKPNRSWGILHLRCPRCHEGEVFSGAVKMNKRCPNCGLKFEREPGYFYGAMYFSYAFAVLFIGVFALIINMFVPTMRLHWLLFTALMAFLPFVPLVFRYSRVLWMYVDRSIDPE